jgi:hypothetical protein
MNMHETKPPTMQEDARAIRLIIAGRQVCGRCGLAASCHWDQIQFVVASSRTCKDDSPLDGVSIVADKA